jgi:hypothetical protein
MTPASMPWGLSPKQTWGDSIPNVMLVSAVSALIVALPSSEFSEKLMNAFKREHIKW